MKIAQIIEYTSYQYSNNITSTNYYYGYFSGIVEISNTNTIHKNEVISFTLNYNTIIYLNDLKIQQVIMITENNQFTN